jgi:hypothetical protein
MEEYFVVGFPRYKFDYKSINVRLKDVKPEIEY